MRKKIGLLIGDENDWPKALEALAGRIGPNVQYRGQSFEIDVERVRIHPFRLTAATSYDLVIDRLAYWHYQPREWLKKAALLNDVYLLNNPFTFQSMEKHAAYCAMIRLGLHIPETWLIPPKSGPDSRKYRVTAARYHDMFDLPEIASAIGYPVYMKPFDGGGWRGVSRISDEEALMRAYDESGQMLMHLQAGLDNYDVFVRSLAIGPQLKCLCYDPSQPLHARYLVRHDFLSPEHGREARIITKLINAFFRWDFNSCEAIVKDGILWPIDFANACPDIAITSLHYYFPWAIKSLLAWSVFCAISERPMAITMAIDPYFQVAASNLSYEEKLGEYERLADAHFQEEEFERFSAESLGHLDDAMWHLAQGDEFDRIIVETVQETFPAREHEQFIAHYRGLLRHWVDAESRS